MKKINNDDVLYTLEDLKKCFNAAREEQSWCGMGGWKSAKTYATFNDYKKAKLNKTKK